MDKCACALIQRPGGQFQVELRNVSLVAAIGSSAIKMCVCFRFKSKRYRDKLRTEIKSLESLLPVDRSAVHRKLDSQTVFRLSIAFFRTKLFMQGKLKKSDKL